MYKGSRSMGRRCLALYIICVNQIIIYAGSTKAWKDWSFILYSISHPVDFMYYF